MRSRNKNKSKSQYLIVKRAKDLESIKVVAKSIDASCTRCNFVANTFVLLSQ
jgi:hypothetical protein